MKDLASNEVARSDPNAQDPRKPRVHRLASHLLSQLSFYPMFPHPPESLVDLTRYHDYQLKVKPNVLLLSSMLQYFCFDVEGSVIINPGKLTRGVTGGVFAKVALRHSVDPNMENIKPKNESENLEVDGNADNALESNWTYQVQVEIVRI